MKEQLKGLLILSAIIVGILFLSGCIEDDIFETPPSSPTSFSDFEFSGIFRGTLNSGGTSSAIEGYVIVDAIGIITIDLLSGRMTGTSTKNVDSYNITITQVTGIFQDAKNITGAIEISTRILYLSGTNVDDSQLTVGGTAPEVLTTGGWENLSKSSVYFTHNESCKASVTINGITFGGLNSHYEQDGLCSPTYALWNTIRQNVDSKQSQILCNSGVLKGLDGQPLSFTDCNTVAFILDKSTNYNYTVNWDNGQTSSGSFTSPSGGGQLPICISNDGPECNYSLIGKWLTSEGNGVTISGLSATFYSFSNNWQLFVNNGTVSVGSLNMRNISQVNSSMWNCQVLFLHIVNGQAVSVAWSVDGSIQMSASGNSITVSATSPFSGGTASAIYNRIL